MLSKLSNGAKWQFVLAIYLCFSVLGAIFTDTHVHMAHAGSAQSAPDLAAAEFLYPDSSPEAFDSGPIDPSGALAKGTFEDASQGCLVLLAPPVMLLFPPPIVAMQWIPAPRHQMAWISTGLNRPPRIVS